MSELIANEDLILTHDIDSATLTITSIPSTKVKANNQGVYRGQIVVTVTNGVSGSCLEGAGIIIIPATATKVKLDNQSVMREGDEGSGVIVGVQSGQPCDINITITIQSAGQSKVKAE